MKVEWEKICVEHTVILNKFASHVNMYISGKTLLLKAVDEWYLCYLRGRYTIYLGITTIDLFDHLMDQYGKSTPTGIK